MGQTALYYAVDNNHTDIMDYLLHHGANPSAAHILRKHSSCCTRYTDSHPHLEVEPLYAAVQNNAFKLLMPLIRATPSMPYHILSTLRDIIFRTGYVQESRLNTLHVQAYAELFSRLLAAPRCLREECRVVIRHTIKCDHAANVKKLPLPVALQHYVYSIR